VLEQIVVILREHVLTCSLCYAKGFICEICMKEKDIIFPFELESTSVCQGWSCFFSVKFMIIGFFVLVCQSCFHYQCHEYKKYHCPKCERNKNRR